MNKRTIWLSMMDAQKITFLKKLDKRRDEIMYLSCFLIQTVCLGHQTADEGKFLFLEIFHLISEEVMLE